VPLSPVLIIEVEDTVLRASVFVGDVESKRQFFLTVLVQVVRDVVLVYVVLISVNPVLPDNFINKLLFEIPSEDIRVLCNCVSPVQVF